MNLLFDLLDSTNDYLKNNYKDLYDLSFVSCEKQTNGRGRNSRVWYAGDNNLLFSLLIKNEKLITNYSKISILTAYSIIKVLENYGLKNLKLKWPNDVFVNDKKICGILLEAITQEKIKCLIVGVGINVNQVEFNEDYLIEPTSLKKELNIDIDIVKLREAVYSRLLNNLKNIDIDYYDMISQYDYLCGKDVYCNINNHKQKVKVIGIDRDYSLIIDLDGERKNIEAGEISFHI